MFRLTCKLNPENARKIFKTCKKFFEKPIDKSIKVWYNKYSEREVNTMTQFEKDVQIFTKHLRAGMISHLEIKCEESVFIIETDDEIFYYDGKTGRELS